MAISALALAGVGCSSNPPAEQANPDLPMVEPSSSSGQLQSRPITGISMTYQNDASTLKMTLDPYDENLDIQIKRSPRPAPVAAPPAPVAKRETIFVAPPPAQQMQPTNITVNTPASQTPVPAPVEKHDTVIVDRTDTAAQAEAMKAREQEWSQATGEILSNIRRAQEYFYKQDYASAWRLVKAAQDKRPTAEGFALEGSIQYMLGDKAAAKFYWTEALKINPNLTEAVEALSRLEGGH